jgi:serine/threonine protein kinase
MRGKANTSIDGQMFAVKIMNQRELRKNGMKVADVTREIEILKKLKHLNVISYYADYSTAKDCCIVMELAPGGSLCEVIFSKPVLEQITRIIYDLSSALHYIHSMGVLHRDVKPEVQNMCVYALE